MANKLNPTPKFKYFSRMHNKYFIFNREYIESGFESVQAFEENFPIVDASELPLADFLIELEGEEPFLQVLLLIKAVEAKQKAQ